MSANRTPWNAARSEPTASMLLSFVIMIGLVSPRAAAKTADDFIEALNQRGYFDTTLDYLDWAETSSLVSDTWRQRIPFHRAVALIEASAGKSAETVKAAATRAEKLLNNFVAAHSDLPEANLARFWHGKLLAEKARQELKSVTEEMTGPAKRKIRGPAAEKFRQAQAEFDQASAYFEEELTAMKNLSPAQLDGRKRDRLRSYYLEAQLNKALIEYELAETVATNKTKYKDQLKVAKQALGDLAVQQSKRLAGVQAKIYLGKCFEDLGEIPDALAIYQEVIDEVSLPELISSQAVIRSMSCSATMKGNPQEAISTGQDWLDKRSPPATSLAAQAVRLEIARQFEAALPSMEPAEQKKQTGIVRSILIDAQQAGGPGRSEANRLMASLGINAPTLRTSGSTSNSSFAAAKAIAEQLRLDMQDSLTLEKLLIDNLSKSKNAENRAEIESNLAAARQELNGKRNEAIQAYRSALAVADDDNDSDEINEVRYLTCYLYYTAERYQEAAVLGEYVARNAAHLPSGKSSANIALASFVKLFQEVPAGEDNSAEAKFLVSMASYIADVWPNSTEAQDSLSMLIGFMINDGKIHEAETYLQKIPASSPRRAEGELRTGQAIRRKYLQEMSAAAGETTPAIDQMKQQAQALLMDGIDRARGAPVTAAIAQGALALSQIYIDVNSPEKALELLSDPELGPLALIGKDAPVAESPGFLEQTYKTALRAQIATLAQPEVDATAAVEKATGTMNALSEAVGDSPEGKRRLTATYISLAKDLQRQLQLSTADSRADIAKAFESFLDQVAEGSTDASVLNWVAETYFSLAEGELTLDSTSTKAREYFTRSASVFGDLLAKSSLGAITLDDTMKTQVRVRAAAANNRCGNYKQAFDLFEEVLGERNAMLNVQVDAAKALQAGGTMGNADMFNQAIKGTRPRDGKNVIWGWEKISKVTAAQMAKGPEQRDRFAPIFFESRYNIARSRYEQGLAAAGGDQVKLLAAAKRAITMTVNLYPDLGGEAWRRKFDRLMKEIQERLGEEASGLATS